MEDLEEKRARRRAKNKAKKEESKRTREEELRRKLYEPKNQRVRLVDAREVDALRGLRPANSTPSVAVNADDFPDLGATRRRGGGRLANQGGEMGSEHLKNQGTYRLQKQELECLQKQGTERLQNQGTERLQKQGTELLQNQGIERLQNQELECLQKQGTELLQNQGTERLQNQGTERLQTHGTPTNASVKPRRADPIQIDVMAALLMSSTPAEKKPPPVVTRRKTATVLHGNQLDSSNPERRKGKIRENQKPQKPSALKTVILQDRRERRERRAREGKLIVGGEENPGDQKPSALKTVILQDRRERQERRAQEGKEGEENQGANMTEAMVKTIVKSEEKTEANKTETMAKLIVKSEEKTEANMTEAMVKPIVKIEVEKEVNKTKAMENANAADSKQLDIEGKGKTEANMTEAMVKPIVESEEKTEANKTKTMAKPIVESEEKKEENASDSYCSESRTEATGQVSLSRETGALRGIHSRKFRDYCDHLSSPDLDAAVTSLISDIVKFQDRQFLSDPVKAHARRRFVLGLRETRKYLTLKKVKLVVIAPDLEVARSKGGLDDAVAGLKEAANSQEVPYVFSLPRSVLRRLTNKSCMVAGISCVGVMNYEGSQDNFRAIAEMLPALREGYERLGSTPAPSPPPPTPHDDKDINQQVVATFLGKLTRELK